ncbi:hypothetical protein [Dermatobacter hominis]|uniref:hypothetical protein n=1 Tax=Dermatobacter hominis TaxID=2884263 RepID=UPI001D10710F|nr:hypothetical protein [Dermatobacter hominis]UDY34583.1 hypothetical protein LH044_14720 [Dermatobacter hominis]
MEEGSEQRDAEWRATEVDRGLSMLSTGMLLAMVLGVSKVGSGFSLAAIGEIVMAAGACWLGRASDAHDQRRSWFTAATGLTLVVVVPMSVTELPERPVAIVAMICWVGTAAALVHALALQAREFGDEVAAMWVTARLTALRRLGLAAAAGIAMLLVAPPASGDGGITAFGIGFGSNWSATLPLFGFGAAAISAYFAIRHPYRTLRAAAQFARNHPAEPTSTAS